MDIYNLSRNWFNWSFENPDKITPNHTALYFFCIEHCNRLGWKEKFGLPTTMAKEAIGIRSYNTYINTLNDLIEFGFIKLIEKSKNQYSSNIIALSNFDKALDKALDKAFIKHATKQCESTIQSIDSIDIQDTKIQDNNITIAEAKKTDENLLTKPSEINQKKSIEKVDKETLYKQKLEKFKEDLGKHLNEFGKEILNEFFVYWTERNPNTYKMRWEGEKTFEIAKRLIRWKNNKENKFKK